MADAPLNEGGAAPTPSSPVDVREALLPCPFCGQDEFLVVSNTLVAGFSWWSVECGCHVHGGHEASEAEAIAAWNTRNPTTPAPPIKGDEREADRLMLALRAIKVVTATAKEGAAGLARIMRIARDAGVTEQYSELLDDPAVALLVSDAPVAERAAALGRRVAECTMPPEGWRCTRLPGHDGPCAAVAVRHRTDTADAGEVERLLTALAKVMPVQIHNTADYAEVYFAEHSTQAMTMNPRDWEEISDAFTTLTPSPEARETK